MPPQNPLPDPADDPMPPHNPLLDSAVSPEDGDLGRKLRDAAMAIQMEFAMSGVWQGEKPDQIPRHRDEKVGDRVPSSGGTRSKDSKPTRGGKWAITYRLQAGQGRKKAGRQSRRKAEQSRRKVGQGRKKAGQSRKTSVKRQCIVQRHIVTFTLHDLPIGVASLSAHRREELLGPLGPEWRSWPSRVATSGRHTGDPGILGVARDDGQRRVHEGPAVPHLFALRARRAAWLPQPREAVLAIVSRDARLLFLRPRGPGGVREFGKRLRATSGTRYRLALPPTYPSKA
ncbi:hypothetical protein B0H13DRAFT_1851148 [Mycena leptocephala]|nr:hypothetical protein B0H13DRAFT_1851148 [Mycena leptocephala]